MESVFLVSTQRERVQLLVAVGWGRGGYLLTVTTLLHGPGSPVRGRRERAKERERGRKGGSNREREGGREDRRDIHKREKERQRENESESGSDSEGEM